MKRPTIARPPARDAAFLLGTYSGTLGATLALGLGAGLLFLSATAFVLVGLHLLAERQT